MSARNKDNQFLMQNYDDILKNCKKSLEKYKLSSSPTSSRNVSAPNARQTTKDRESLEASCSRPDFELHEECFRRLECSKWIETLPPVWDDFLQKDYVEYVVHELLEDSLETCRTSSKISEDVRRADETIKHVREKSDKAILVKDSDLIDDVQAVWKAVSTKESISPPKKTQHSKETTPVRAPPPIKLISKRRVLTTVTKPPIPLKAKKTGRIFASVSKPPTPNIIKKPPLTARPKSSQSATFKKTPPTPQGSRKLAQSTKLSPYSRFLGKPRKLPIDFSVEHPGLVLQDTLEATSFPCRLEKSDEAKNVGNEKSNVSSEVASIAREKSLPRSPTQQTTDQPCSSSKTSREHIDKTWQEVFLEGTNKAKDERFLRHNRLSSPSRPSSSSSSPSEKEASGRDVIYDQTRIVRPNERAASKKLIVQKLPVLCIRGECKVQKIVEISIGGAEASGPKEDRGNVKLFEYSHKTESPKSHKGVKNAKNIEIQITAEENEKEMEVVKDEEDHKGIGSIEALPKYELSRKSSNRFMAPFLDLNDYKIAASSEKTPEPSRSSEDPPLATQQSTSGVNNFEDVSSSAQTDDEKLQKGSSSLKSSSSSSSSCTNPRTSDEMLESNQQPNESLRTIQSSIEGGEGPEGAEGVSHSLFNDENIQMKLNDTREVQNILNEVFSEEEDHGNGDGDGGGTLLGDGHRKTVGIDCSDLMRGIEISVQTEDIMGNYSMGPRKELTNSSLVEREDKTVDQIVERICRDETDAVRKFKLRTVVALSSDTAASASAPSGETNTPSGRIDFNVTNANDLAIDDRLARMFLGESIKANSGGAASKHPISETIRSAPTPLSQYTFDRSARLGNATEFRADNYTDNLGAIKGDEVEERSHQTDEVSSSSCLGSHANLLGRKCYCRQHRWQRDDEFQSGGGAGGKGVIGRKGREFAYEPVLSPLRDLYDTNLRLNSPLMQSNYDELSEMRSSWRSMRHKDFQKLVLEANPRFSRTLAKIYDAAPNVTAKPSNRMDPEVQRAVKKFLKSLLEPQTPESSRKGRYTKLNNVLPTHSSSTPHRSGQSLSGITPKGWTTTSTSLTSSSASSPKHQDSSHPKPDHRTTFSSLWKSNCDSTTLSETESSDLQRMLYAPLWNDLPIKATMDNLRGLTGSSSSSIDFVESTNNNQPPHHSGGSVPQSQHHAKDISDGEVLSLGEVRSFDS